ncbi:ABC transporter ATP-binding protein [Intrasporangium sp. YIM S08009]|uniref:ABC transporter ATP-binding protein n=1 Tax=Intrasporangium zincisolvens TaxID=3080018 RepID=UPI002B05F2F9|nr:ABC transporter ATP-binding protein [Intrasporangium sp. YIM S08009]
MQPWMAMRSMSRDSSVAERRLAPGTRRRVLGYARPFRSDIAAFLVVVVLDSLLVVAVPLLLKAIVDDGVVPKDSGVVVKLSLLVAVIAVVDVLFTIVSRWYSARIGEGLINDLRVEVFGHVLRQPIAFFTRAQTGSLVSRLNNDVVGAQQAFTSVLSNVVSNVVSVVLVVGAMFALSWQLTLGSLLLVPLFLIPARLMGRRLAALAHRQMTLNADMGTRMTERFNVAGALLVKLFGSPVREEAEYADRAGRVRDIGIEIAVNRTLFMAGLTFVAALATAMVYGFGGVMAVNGTLSVGTLLALAALLARLYGPLTSLSNVRVDIMTALISFERVFEVLDLEPLVKERPGAVALPAGPLGVTLEDVSFRYPSADEISLASLESVASGDRRGSGVVLHDIDVDVPAGSLVALVGPSGAGKTTLTSLVARLYDPSGGAVRIGGVDLRDVTMDSLRDRVGVVTQEAHLFHDTIRANLLYARPDATDEQVAAALRAAQISELVEELPEGLDTVVGDRGHRLSGGEKQRFAIARLLLKAPDVVVLDEATAHLDSESEVAVQRALDAALEGRTSIVIAHRLSTIRQADLIVVLDHGRVVETGRHAELLARGGLYADLHATQFDEKAVERAG